MKGIIGSFLSMSDTEAKVTIVARDGKRRVSAIPLLEARRIVDQMKSRGFTGEFPRSSRPQVNVREFVANLGKEKAGQSGNGMIEPG